MQSPIHLFDINETPTQGESELAKQVRPEMQTSVAFILTESKELDNGDYRKLHQVIKYLCGIPDLPLTLDMAFSGSTGL